MSDKRKKTKLQRHILVTAGPTREPLDPVRYISNRSSGKMGYAIARAAARQGHEVTLISGPVALKPPANVQVVHVQTATDMLKAVRQNLQKCGILIMAAAVADWRAGQVAPRKIKKHADQLLLTLSPTPDILQSIKKQKGRRLFVGFAAETENLIAHAETKLRAKGLDYILANDVSRKDIGFDVDDNQVTIIAADGTRMEWPRMSKTRLANRLIKLILVDKNLE